VKGAKMKILATISFGDHQITQTWDFLKGDPSPWLVVIRPQDGAPLIIKLDKQCVKDLAGSAGREKVYVGGLNISQATVIKHA
jgi:hypothetical protein